MAKYNIDGWYQKQPTKNSTTYWKYLLGFIAILIFIGIVRALSKPKPIKDNLNYPPQPPYY